MSASRILLEFSSARRLQVADHALRTDSWPVLDTFSPVPADDDAETAIALRPRSLPRVALIAGLVGGLGIFAFEYYAAVVDYAIDVGGRPHDSWIAFVPAMIETALLGAALGVVISFLVAARLPRFHHPLFDIEEFARASDNRYFLLVDRPSPDERDRDFHQRMTSLDVIAVHEVRDDA